MRYTLIERIINWYSLKTGNRYWFSVVLRFKKDGVEIGTYTSDVGTAVRADIINYRAIKKRLINGTIQKQIIEHDLLHNCLIELQVVCYIGYFKGRMSR
jgi:hypothetical protein